MQCKVLPSHRAGLICAGDPLFLAMPRLPDQSPFYTGNETDPDTGVSTRLYYGAFLVRTKWEWSTIHCSEVH